MKNLKSIAEHSDWLEDCQCTNNRKWHLHRQRVEFGKQPLAIWQFIPCKLVDGVWVVLEGPHPFKEGDCKEQNKLVTDIRFNEYQQAKETCIFEGFESVPFTNSVRKGNYTIDFNYTENSDVESLLHNNIGLELTATAKKQIGL